MSRKPRTEYMRDYRRKYYKINRSGIIFALGGRCSECQTTEGLDIHHIRPLKTPSGRGQLIRLFEWRQAMQIHPINLELLCTEHHRERTQQQGV